MQWFAQKCGYDFLRNSENCVDTMMTDEHAPTEALINILLSSTLSATNLMSLEESQPIWDLVLDFLVVSADLKNSLCSLLSTR